MTSSQKLGGPAEVPAEPHKGSGVLSGSASTTHPSQTKDVQ